MPTLLACIPLFRLLVLLATFCTRLSTYCGVLFWPVHSFYFSRVLSHSCRFVLVLSLFFSNLYPVTGTDSYIHASFRSSRSLFASCIRCSFSFFFVGIKLLSAACSSGTRFTVFSFLAISLFFFFHSYKLLCCVYFVFGLKFLFPRHNGPPRCNFSVTFMHMLISSLNFTLFRFIYIMPFRIYCVAFCLCYLLAPITLHFIFWFILFIFVLISKSLSFIYLRFSIVIYILVR